MKRRDILFQPFECVIYKSKRTQNERNEIELNERDGKGRNWNGSHGVINFLA